ncbi:hypothetical protein INT47_011977 [Mucor saturninus]|uniref:Uncharacterized protein n=1 Tax=Mucor saturninus TaxID=64648 RepID=A0A8H7V407_9FUNG|nr:hypothetical protein INT47_011977 [Mucor saturninus]
MFRNCSSTGQNYPVKASNKVLEVAVSFKSTIRDFVDNNDDNKIMKVRSTGMLRNGNHLFIGEVVKIDAPTIFEYALWCERGTCDKIQTPKPVRRFKLLCLLRL